MTPTIDRDDLIAAAEALVAADGELNEQEVKMLRILIESVEESEENSFSLNETEVIWIYIMVQYRHFSKCRSPLKRMQ